MNDKIELLKSPEDFELYKKYAIKKVKDRSWSIFQIYWELIDDNFIKEIKGEIIEAIIKNPFIFGDKACIIFSEIKNNSKILEDEGIINAFIKGIEEHDGLDGKSWKFFPEKIQNNPVFKQAFKRQILNKKFIYEELPDFLKEDIEIKDIRKKNWIKKLSKNKSYTHCVPEEFKNDPEFKEALLKSLIENLKNNPLLWKEIPKDKINHPEVKEALKIGCIESLKINSYFWKLFPEYMKNDSDIIKTVIEKWTEEALENPYNFEHNIKEEIPENILPEIIKKFKETLIKESN